MSWFEAILVGVVTSLVATLIWDALTHYVPWLGGVPAGRTA